MNSFGEILAHFKKVEDAENIVPLIEDGELRNAVVAWKSVAIQYVTPLQECRLQDESARWNWLWTQVSYDKVAFGIVAGLKAQDAGKVISRLVGLRLIYPDGTINNYSRQYLTSIILHRLGMNKKSSIDKKIGNIAS